MVTCGVNFSLFLSFELLEAVFLTLSVVAMIKASGPAAATSPRLDATDKSEAVVDGKFSLDHGVGKKLCTLFSAARAWKPKCSVSIAARSSAALADMFASLQLLSYNYATFAPAERCSVCSRAVGACALCLSSGSDGMSVLPYELVVFIKPESRLPPNAPFGLSAGV